MDFIIDANILFAALIFNLKTLSFANLTLNLSSL